MSCIELAGMATLRMFVVFLGIGLGACSTSNTAARESHIVAVNEPEISSALVRSDIPIHKFDEHELSESCRVTDMFNRVSMIVRGQISSVSEERSLKDEFWAATFSVRDVQIAVDEVLFTRSDYADPVDGTLSAIDVLSQEDSTGNTPSTQIDMSELKPETTYVILLDTLPVADGSRNASTLAAFESSPRRGQGTRFLGVCGTILSEGFNKIENDSGLLGEHLAVDWAQAATSGAAKYADRLISAERAELRAESDAKWLASDAETRNLRPGEVPESVRLQLNAVALDLRNVKLNPTESLRIRTDSGMTGIVDSAAFPLVYLAFIDTVIDTTLHLEIVEGSTGKLKSLLVAIPTKDLEGSGGIEIANDSSYTFLDDEQVARAMNLSLSEVIALRRHLLSDPVEASDGQDG